MSLVLDIEKRLGNFHLKTAVECGNEVLSLLGASGCGKSMTLKCIAGIEKPDRGRIVVDGHVLFDSESGINLSVQQRRVGLLFQNYALFPNMTIAENIRMGTKREGGCDEAYLCSVLERFSLTEVAFLYPHQISGGQQQRAALARILISKPDILLLDEPFAALDSHLRFRMEEEIRSVIRSFGKTVLLVSHNRDEVFRLSDQVAVMKNGKIDRAGKKTEVFRDPGTVHAAALTGCKNISPIRILDAHHFLATDWDLTFCVSKIPEDAEYVGIRMHYIHPGEGENTFACSVTEEIENPFSYTVMLKKNDKEQVRSFGWELDKEAWKKYRNPEITVHIPETSLHFLKK